MAQGIPSSEQDARSLARRDRGLPIRRHAPAEGPESGSAVRVDRGFADGDDPAPTTGDREPESQQELFSRHGRDLPPSALLAAVRAGWGSTRRVAAATFAVAREVIPPEPRWGV